MNSKRLALAFLVVTAAFPALGRAQEGASSKPTAPVPQATQSEASWGEVDLSGLQLGAWQLQPQSPLILCVIRNQGQKSVAVNLGTLGEWDYVSVLARPAGNTKWQRLTWKWRTNEGIGPSTYKVVDLSPQQQLSEVLVSNRWRYDTSTSSSFLLTPARSPSSNRTFTFPPAPALPPHTFTLGLFSLDWPVQWTGTVELRVEQSLWSDKQRPSWEGTLSSGVLQVRFNPERDKQPLLHIFGAPIDPAQALGELARVRQNDISDVILQKGTGGQALSTEGFKQLMKTATPMSEEEFKAQQIPAGYRYKGSFSNSSGTYTFTLGIGPVNYLRTPRGATVRFKFNQSFPVK